MLSNEDIILLNESSKFFSTTNEKDIAKMDVVL